MSVLYKALQKAAKENEDQAAAQAAAQSADADGEAASPFDPERLAGAGAISGGRAGGIGANWRVAGIASAVVLALVIVVAFFLVDSDEQAPVQVAQAPTAAPVAPVPVAPAPVATDAPASAPQSPMDVARSAAQSSSTSTLTAPVAVPMTADAPMAANDIVTESVVASAPVVAAVQPTATPVAEVAPVIEEEPQPAPAAPAPVAQAPIQTAAVVPTAPARSDPMPQFDANSPARVLSPPISIRRADAEFAGLGNVVQVREVSQSAQDNVTAGYNALVRGDVGSALQLYSDALSSEPTSVMAQLGRSASLQRLGRLEEARTGYEAVLRIDPNNRQALANLTSIFSTRAPNEALSRLLDLEREYPQFSPVKAQIGLLYARMGSNDQAMAYLREAASMSPATVMYQYNLAVLLDRMGRAEQAVFSYERVLAGILNGGVASDLSRSSIERRVRYLKTL
ncbi:MAG: tetratricopeptide repeat protein [Rhodospirillaceae bacterium]|nr:tetratricopeptide repeat protein [Rhodospirillaceae bacterium]MBT5565716.1 tetratricopeptide repeat protein [Rhodospirillaceae bacterium]MBT6090791.1 tetratricopeptide repeat protein [Rhodospirillaceae bacterium]MBT6960579.1 tetratricopeptide repeat protein [Rhodospirillaceae bacterium]MBT7450875.1 tetratricopeptide repeat protein [Rhodospirillaceae bacterium]